MDEQLNPNEYRTGHTHPNERNAGPIAALLIGAIFLGGMATGLSFLSKQLSQNGTPPIIFTQEDPVDSYTEESSHAPHPPLGFTCQNMAMTYQYVHHLPHGLFINYVEPGSLASSLGIVPGDILISFDGTPVTTAETLTQLLANCTYDHQASLVIHRKDGPASFIITLNRGA